MRGVYTRQNEQVLHLVSAEKMARAQLSKTVTHPTPGAIIPS